MARRMYDLDNGTESIKVKEIATDKITANTTSAITVTKGLVIGQTGTHILSVSGGASFGGYVQFPTYPTVARPTVSGQVGAVIYDSTLGKLILWNGTAWVNLDGTALS